MVDAIPLVDLPGQLAALEDELVAEFRAALRSGQFVGGAQVAAFEAAFAARCGRDACVGVGSGTDALILSLRALGVGPGDTVVVPALTFVATAAAVSWLGATPLFVDVEPETLTLGGNALDAVDGREVAAVIAVHLFGHPADMPRINAWAGAAEVAVIEDAAQAHGATLAGRPVGSLGGLGAFSFYPTKNLGALGDAGAVVGPAGGVMDRLRALADHGRRGRHEFLEVGINSRLDAIQAAALRCALPHLERWNAARREVAAHYRHALESLSGVGLPGDRRDCRHVYHAFVIEIAQPASLQRRLAAAGIASAIHYPTVLPLQPAFAALGHRPGDFPVAEAAAACHLALPMFPHLGAAQVRRVAQVVTDHLDAVSAQGR